MKEIGNGASRICIPSATYNPVTRELEVPNGVTPIVVEDNIFHTKSLLAADIPQTASSTTPECKDSSELIPYKGRLLPCEWIASKPSRIETACVAGGVAITKCPVTCKACPLLTKAPTLNLTSITKPSHIHGTSASTSDQSTVQPAKGATDSPTSPTSPPKKRAAPSNPPPPSLSCEDTSELVTFQGRRLPCAWIASKATRVELVCGSGGEALIKCPHTCNSCPAPSNSVVATMSPHSVPTSAPTQKGAAVSVGNKMFVSSSSFTTTPTISPTAGVYVSASTKVFASSSSFTVPPSPSPSADFYVDNKVFPSKSTFTHPPTSLPSSSASAANSPTSVSSAADSNVTFGVPQLRTTPCKDTPNLIFYMGRFVPCSWIAMDQSRVDLACGKESDAVVSCPATCNSCGASTPLTRIAPGPGASGEGVVTTTHTSTVEGTTPSPTAAPTRHRNHVGHGAHTEEGVSPANDTRTTAPINSTLVHDSSSTTPIASCMDGIEDFDYQNRQRNCAWIATARSRVRYACVEGQPAYEICQATCHRCESSSSAKTSSSTSTTTITRRQRSLRG